MSTKFLSKSAGLPIHERHKQGGGGGGGGGIGEDQGPEKRLYNLHLYDAVKLTDSKSQVQVHGAVVGITKEGGIRSWRNRI